MTSYEVIEAGRKKFPQFEKTHLETYGIHSFETQKGLRVASISCDTWEGFAAQAAEVKDHALVVSPELITVAGNEPLDRQLVESRISYVKTASCSNPETVYLLGTPLWINKDQEKPYNAAVCIKNGGQIGFLTKKTNATPGEFEAFEFAEEVPEESALIVVGDCQIQITICADFAAYMSLEGRDLREERLKRSLRMWGKHSLASFDAFPRTLQVYDEAEAVVVLSAWGIGGNTVMINEAPDVNDYYRRALISSALKFMDRNDNLHDIIVTDRVPVKDESDGDTIVATVPFNMHARRVF
jgi:predicted amidohydrolase